MSKNSNTELERAKEFACGHMILGMEDSKNIAEIYGNQILMESKIRTSETILDMIRKVRLEEVVSVSESVFKDNHYNLAAIGPFEHNDNKALAKLLI